MEILSIHLLPAGFTLMLEQPYHLSQSWTRWLPHVWPQYEHENMLQYDAVRNHCIPSTRFWVEVSLLLPPWAPEWVIDLWGPTSCHNPGVPSAPIWEVVQMKWETGLPFCLPLHLLPKMCDGLQWRKHKKKRSNSLWKKDETERSISILSADWVTGKCLEVLMREGKHSGYIWCLVLLPRGNQVIGHPHLKMAFWFVFWKPTRHMYQVKTGGLLPLSSICPNETIPEIKSYIRIAQLLSKIQ